MIFSCNSIASIGIINYWYHYHYHNYPYNHQFYSYLYHQCSDLENEGVFRNYYTGEELDPSVVATGDLDGGEAENCAIVVGVWNAWSDWSCIVPKVQH